MSMTAILVMWPGPFEQFFVPPIPGGYSWNLVTIGLVVSEEKSFEIVDGRRRTTEPAYTISSPGAFGSGELKRLFSVRECSDDPAAWLTWSWHVQMHFSQLITDGWIYVICMAAGWIAHYPPDYRVNRCLFIREPDNQASVINGLTRPPYILSLIHPPPPPPPGWVA